MARKATLTMRYVVRIPLEQYGRLDRQADRFGTSLGHEIRDTLARGQAKHERWIPRVGVPLIGRQVCFLVDEATHEWILASRHRNGICRAWVVRAALAAGLRG